MLLVRPMQRRRERIVDASDLIVTPSAAILPAGTPREKIVELEWGADTDAVSVPDATGPLPVRAAARARWRCSPAPFATGMAPSIWRARCGRCTRAAARTSARSSSATARNSPTVRAEAQGLDNVVFTGAVPHDQMPACLAAADIGVAPFDLGAHKPLALGFYWSPLKIFEYMAAGLPVVAPAADRIPQLVEGGVEGLLYQPAAPVDGLANALERLTDAETSRPARAPPRARASNATTRWRSALREAGRRHPARHGSLNIDR